MTVTYTLEVSRARFWGFPKLLLRWRGSIYRLIYQEMSTFLLLYYSILSVYRHLLYVEHQKRFESIALYCREFTSTIPITFVMGFYVTFVVGRWWQQYMNIPWPDRLCMQISAYVHGADERGRLMRRAMARYANLLALLTFRSTSTVMKRRFPTVEHIQSAGLLTEEERATLESIPTSQGTWSVAAFNELSWGCSCLVKRGLQEMQSFRGQCGMIWSYDWISVPLVYTQVVTLAVYSFFVACLLGRQFLLQTDNDQTGNTIDYYFPVFTIFQFCFYVGWLKVAESMICPFGEDDDDFELNWILDRNVQVAYLIVDSLHQKIPRLVRDQFWDTAEPDVPYTSAAANYKKDAWVGSTQAMNISSRDAEWEVEEMPIIGEADEEQAMDKREENDNNSVASSTSSVGENRTKKRGRLATLLLGASRQTLFSKSGSKRSVLDRTRSEESSHQNLEMGMSQDLVQEREDSMGSPRIAQMAILEERESETESTGQRTLTLKEGQLLATHVARIRQETEEKEDDKEKEDGSHGHSDSSTTPLCP